MRAALLLLLLISPGRSEPYLNANATGGAVWAGIVNEDGFRLPGFDKSSCVPLRKDATRCRMTWREKKLTNLPPGNQLIRLHLQNAAIDAITLR